MTGESKNVRSKDTQFGQHKMSLLLLHTLEFRSCSRSLQILGIVECRLIILNGDSNVGFSVGRGFKPLILPTDVRPFK